MKRGRPLGARAMRFAHVPAITGGAMYVLELTGGVVKIGHSTKPARRLQKITEELDRSGSGQILRYFVCDPLPTANDARRMETRAIALLSQMATQLPRRLEYFTGIEYESAVAAVCGLRSARA